MILKKDANFEVKLTFYLKNDMKFKLSSGKSKNLHFDGLLLQKACNFLAKEI